jgi:8-oxo-dGTP pyrophosphatase MutT (NUDIX family)
MKLNLPPDKYYEQLAKVPTAASAFFRNDKGEFLIVKNPYREHYVVAGGMSEENETPLQTVIRETREELDIDTKNARVFCVDFTVTEPFDRVLFLFDCGVLDDKTIQTIKPDVDEIESYRFVSYEEMIRLVSPKFQKRILNSIEALRSDTCIYLESGMPLKF